MSESKTTHIYHVVFADDEQLSPYPTAVWYSLEEAEIGADYWSKRTGRKCKVVEEKP